MKEVQSLPQGPGRDAKHEQGHVVLSPGGPMPAPRPSSRNWQPSQHTHGHTCTHTRTHRYTNTDIHTCTHTGSQTHAHIHDTPAHARTGVPTCTRVQTHVYTQRHIQAGIYVHTETRTYTHRCQYVHTCLCAHRNTPLFCFTFLLCMYHNLTHCLFHVFIVDSGSSLSRFIGWLGHHLGQLGQL